MEQGWTGKAAAELVATFALVFFGAGSIIVSDHLGADGYGLLGIAAVHAITLALFVSATMKISGGHVNPAITIAAFLTRKIEAKLAGAYIIAQISGAILGALFLRSLMPAASLAATGYGTPQVADGLDPMTALAIELVLTFALGFVIWGTAISKRAPQGIAGFAIGLTIFVDIMVGGPFTGAAMNPARVLGPAIVGGVWGMHWIYWVGPVLGAALAAAIYEGVVEKAASD